MQLPAGVSGPRMTFQIGEKVVYPNHGVGTIENISMRSFGNRMERYYLLRLSCNNLTVMVPFSHVDDIGLRKITRNCETHPHARFSRRREMQALRRLEGSI